MMMGASIFHFARGLAARNFFSGSDMRGFVWQQLKFRLGGEGSPEDVRAHREQALSFVAGQPVAELVELGEEIYDELMADRIWEGTRALAQMHLDAGQRVWLVTATPLELARIIARRLGLTGALGTVAESEDGVFTGRLVGELLHGPAKAHAVRALAAREGLDLRRCAAYSDSVNDAPMLSVVGTAVAVNPDSDLRQMARRRGWEIRDFRSGRKVARIGVPSVLGAGAVAGRGGRRRGLPPPRQLTRLALSPGTSAQEGVPPAREQPVERLLDVLAHLVGQVEHQHRVVGRARVVGVRGDRLAELDVPLRRQRDEAERARAAARSA